MKVDIRLHLLNELHALCRETADNYRFAAEKLDEPDLAGWFRRQAEERESLAGRLEAQIRELGLPRMPDPEKEGLEHVWTQLKTAFTDDKRKALLLEREKQEENLAALARSALEQDLSAETRALLQESLERFEAARRRLAQA